MKKLNIFKSVIVISFLSLGLTVSANQETNYAKCTTYGTHSFGGYEFHLPSPFQTGKRHVEVTSNGKTISVEANFGLSSWVTVQAEFEFEGKNINFQFSNFLSPSIGYGEIDGDAFTLACQLL